MPQFYQKRQVYEATQVTVPDPAFVFPNSDPPITVPLAVGSWIIELDGEFYGAMSDADFQARYEEVV